MPKTAYLEAMLSGTFVPFGAVTVCPACQASRTDTWMHLYCEVQHVRGVSDGESSTFVNDQKMGDERVPHLHVTCGNCDFTWLEHPSWVS